MKEKMLNHLNKQINEELFSAYLYLSMSAHFEDQGLKGFAHWMRVQAKEEIEHAMRIYQHIIDRGGRVVLEAIAVPPKSWPTPKAASMAAFGVGQDLGGTAIASKTTRPPRSMIC